MADDVVKTPRTDAIKAELYREFPEPITNARKLLYYIAAAETYGQACREMEMEINRRRGDPCTRLHNLCEGLEADKQNSPYSAESWDELIAENDRLRRELSSAEARALAAENEAALWKGRYDYLRALHVPDFASLFTYCIANDVRYDEEVDRRRALLNERGNG